MMLCRAVSPNLPCNFGQRLASTFTKAVETTLERHHRIIAEGGIPPSNYEYQKEKWAVGELFGQYGLSSGVDIRKLWPSVEEVKEEKALKLYRSAQEAMNISKDASQFEKIRKMKKELEIDENLKSHQETLDSFKSKDLKKEGERSEEEAQLEKRIREVQEFFGYWIDPADPRFEVILSQKEEQHKKEAKKAKKAALKAG